MKSVGIITFHASHNYGSMLQAYALQQTVKNLGFDCRIINLRTPLQKKLYLPFYRSGGWRNKAKAICFPCLALADRRKQQLFESFIRDYYVLSDIEYSSAEELRNNPPVFDYYISGSDQIWNTGCWDFEKSYFLDFVQFGKRIAYAPSMGPVFDQINDSSVGFIADCLCRYDALSVREPGTARQVKQIVSKDPIITADPTLLLADKQWDSIAGSDALVEGDYLLLYAPHPAEYSELYREASEITEEKGIKVVCTLSNGYPKLHRLKDFKFFTAVGPTEFLNLVKFSKYMMCGSFHAVVFSIIFRKPFYAYKGMEDSRISNLLKITDLERCAEHLYEFSSFDFLDIQNKLRPYIESSRQFLIDSLK